MTTSIEALRRRARKLHKAYEAGHTSALQRVSTHNPRSAGDLLHADFLFVVAREEGFESWPKLKLAAETQGLAFAQKLQRLNRALYHGQIPVIERLLMDTPALADNHFGLQVALFNKPVVQRMLRDAPALATTPFGRRRPLLHLSFSRYLQYRPDLTDDMIAIAEMLVLHGADVNDSYQPSPDTNYQLSALYGAVGHSDNLVLARWLLDHGANPDDGESLYHSTEPGRHEGLKMLLEQGANPTGTNALLRALDFNDSKTVQLLLSAGAEINDGHTSNRNVASSGMIPALHQAARRMSDSVIVELLFQYGADPAQRFQGTSAYAFARVFGNTALADAIEKRGGDVSLSDDEQLLANAADGDATSSRYINPAVLPEAYRDIIRLILHLPGKLPHIKRLVALGVEYDRPDAQGVTAVQIAGWEGLPEMLGYMLSLKPDLSHANSFGGTLLSTIIHGAENCPARRERDYLSCVQLVLNEGVALPSTLIDTIADVTLARFLTDWAGLHPGQVVT